MDIADQLPKTLFQGKTVFVTGGTSGINLGIARSFAAVGAKLAVCGRSREKAEHAAQGLREQGGEVRCYSVDVRDFEALRSAMDEAGRELGPIHTLVAGAAGNFPCPAETLSANGFKTVIDIDLLGAFNAARAAFDQLRQTHGNVIFISAGQAFMPYAFQAHVGAAKAGIDQMMRDLALEWGRHGIRCNSIAPGPIDGTEGVKRLVPEGMRPELERAIPLGRFGTVEEMGQVAVFLASPLASYVTGTVLVADGGQNLPGSGVWTQAILQASGDGSQRKPAS